MLITLTDGSVALLDEATLRFRHRVPGESAVVSPDSAVTVRQSPFGVNAVALAATMGAPAWRFGDCFRRASDVPSYSPKSGVHSFSPAFLTKLYCFPGSYQGGTFCPSTRVWKFLDGGIRSHSGYGWGSHSWTVVEGAEALRGVCLFFGVKQPLKIRGEGKRRPLAMLLEEMTSVPLQDSRGTLLGLPSPLEST